MRLLTRAPLAGAYWPAVALALLALCPFIVLTTAAALFEQNLVHDLHTTRFGVQLSSGLANAGYAFGAVAAADLILRIPGRRLYLACEALFLAGSVLGALAPGIVLFTLGRVLQGLGTGMLLVAALPPLVTGHGAQRLPATGAVVNLGLFGMVTLGPVVGGIAGSFHAWRLLFAAVAALGAAGIVMALLAFEYQEAPRRGVGFDWLAIPLALGSTFLPFFGVSWLTRGSFASVGFLAPVVVGLAIITALLLAQYHKRDPLMPVRPISHTLPITGTAGAMLVGAGYTTLLVLAEVYLQKVTRHSPAATGGLLAAQLLGIALAAWLFKRVLPTKWTPVLALAGLVGTIAGGALLIALSPGTAGVVAVFAGFLLGFGAGAGVAPGLFMAGFSVLSTKVGQTFALVELLRSEAAFLVGPVLLHVAMTAGGGLASGLTLAIEIVVGILVVGGLALLGVYFGGGARPHEPDLQGWVDGETTAYDSPRFLARVRDGDTTPVSV